MALKYFSSVGCVETCGITCKECSVGVELCLCDGGGGGGVGIFYL